MPDWTHVRDEKYATQDGSQLQVALVECYHARNRAYSNRYQTNPSASDQYGFRALVVDALGSVLFNVEGWVARDHDETGLQTKVLTEAGRRIDNGQWSPGITYVVGGH